MPGDETPPEGSGTEAPPRPRRRPAPELRAKIDAAGGALRLVDDLLSQMDDLRGQVEQAKRTGTLPAGAVVLKGDDAKAWERLKALGTADDVVAAVTERDTLRTTLAERDAQAARDTAADQAASALGWNAKALRTFAADKRLTLEVRDEDVDDGRGGKVKKPVPYVVTAAATATEAAKAEPLAAVVTRDHDVYLPALTAQTPRPANGSGGAPRPTPTGGTPYPAAPLHPSHGGSGGGDVELRQQKASSGAYAI